MNKFKPGFFDRFPYTIPEMHLESVEYLRWRFFAKQLTAENRLLTMRENLYLSMFSPVWENTDQNNSEYGHFLRSVIFVKRNSITPS